MKASAKIIVFFNTIFTLLLILNSNDALSYYCMEPNSAPSCITVLVPEKFKSDYEFLSCKKDVERYIEELNKWRSCVDQAAVNRGNEAIKKFNCRAKGEMICF